MKGNASADVSFYRLKEEFAYDLDQRGEKIKEAEENHLTDQMNKGRKRVRKRKESELKIL